MGINVIAQPGEIALSRNPIRFQFNLEEDLGDPYVYRGPASEARGSTYFYLANGDTIIIAWTEPDGSTDSVTFTAVLSPSAENEIYAFNPGGGHVNTYNLNAQRMQDHSRIHPFFKVYADDNGSGMSFWVEVREFNDDWGVELGGTVTGGTFNYFDYATSSNGFPAGVKILFEVFGEETYLDGDFVELASLEAVPDPDGNVSFDIAEIMDKLVISTLADPPLPAIGASTVTKADVLRRYYVRYRLDFTGVSSPAWTYSAIKLILCGGVEQGLHLSGDFFGDLSATNSLLTWYPDGKNLSADQPEYLAWINYTGSDVEVSIELYRFTTTEALSRQVQYNFNGVTLAPWEVALIPVGPAELSSITSATVKYTVQVIDDSTVEVGPLVYLSQKRTYYVDRSYHTDRRYLLYHNSFCCPASLRCTGERSKALEVERLLSDKIITTKDAATTPEQFQYNDEWNNSLIYRTGYLSRAEVDALQELLIYNRAYEIQDGAYVPLLLTGDTWQITRTRQFLHSLEFDVIPALRPINYTQASPSLPDIPMVEVEPPFLVDDDDTILIDDSGAGLVAG